MLHASAGLAALGPGARVAAAAAGAVRSAATAAPMAAFGARSTFALRFFFGQALHDAQLIERARCSGLGELQFHAERGQYGKELAGTQFAHMPAFKARKGFLGDASLNRDGTLPQAESLAPCCYSLPQFLKCLHLIYTSKMCEIVLIIDE